jgi:hypothetical protein
MAAGRAEADGKAEQQGSSFVHYFLLTVNQNPVDYFG